MKIAILQPTPFRKGHYFIYTKSLFDKIYSYGKKVKIISALKTYDVLKNENPVGQMTVTKKSKKTR